VPQSANDPKDIDGILLHELVCANGDGDEAPGAADAGAAVHHDGAAGQRRPPPPLHLQGQGD